MMKALDHLPDLLIVLGALGVVGGVALVSPPAAVIIAGLVALGIGVLLSLRPKKS